MFGNLGFKYVLYTDDKVKKSSHSRKKKLLQLKCIKGDQESQLSECCLFYDFGCCLLLDFLGIVSLYHRSKTVSVELEISNLNLF